MDNIPRTHEDIEAQIKDLQSKKKDIQLTNAEGVALLDSGGFFDTELYDDQQKAGKSRYEGYNTSIAVNDEADEDEDDGFPVPQKKTAYSVPKIALKEVTQGKEDFDPMADRRRPTIADREDEYRQKRRRILISPERADPFADGQRNV